jgi:hypothetical protein
MTDWTITDTTTKTLYTVEQADKWLRKTLTNRQAMHQFYDDLAGLDELLNVHPRLRDVAALNHRRELMRDPVWPTLPESLRKWLAWTDEADIGPITDAVISAAVAFYRQETA